MERILAIDAGAWGASAAVAVDGDLRFYPGAASGKRLAPMISVDRKGGVYVGDSARRKAVLEPTTTVVSPMRLLGRFPGDLSVRRAVEHSQVKVVPGPAGHATVNLAGHVYSLPEVISQQLSHLKSLAERDLGEELSKTVLVVPCCYGDAQRQSLLLAARLAGLEVVRVLSAPMAAALNHQNDSGERNCWLVVDAGGSQIGAAVIDIRDRVAECVGLASDCSVGLLDVDTALVTTLAQDFEQSTGHVLTSNPTARARLLFAAENAKRSLVEHEQVRIRLREFVAAGNESVTFDGSLDRTTLQQLGRPYAEAVLAASDEAMQAAGVESADLAGLLLVGGGAQLPQVVEDLGALVGHGKEIQVLGPESLAAGAARYGAALVGNPSMAVDDIRMLSVDAAGTDLVVATAGGYNEVVVPVGARLPISAHRVFTTNKDNQTQVRILISQAPRGTAPVHARLGEFVLDGLKPGERGRVRIDVAFELDVDGLLHVSARDLETGHRTASDVRISQAVAEQALAAVCEARSLSEDTLKQPVGGAPRGPLAPIGGGKA